MTGKYTLLVGTLAILAVISVAVFVPLSIPPPPIQIGPDGHDHPYTVDWSKCIVRVEDATQCQTSDGRWWSVSYTHSSSFYTEIVPLTQIYLRNATWTYWTCIPGSTEVDGWRGDWWVRCVDIKTQKPTSYLSLWTSYGKVLSVKFESFADRICHSATVSDRDVPSVSNSTALQYYSALLRNHAIVLSLNISFTQVSIYKGALPTDSVIFAPDSPYQTGSVGCRFTDVNWRPAG